MEIKEAIKIIKGLIRTAELGYNSNPLSKEGEHTATKALTLAIAALEKLEAIKSCTPPSDDWEHYADRLHDIAYQSGYKEGKQERDKWNVIAKDGLPKKDGDYLVCYEEGYREDYSLDEIGIAPFEVDCEGFGFWVESFDKHTLGSLGSDWTEIKATAWKPLPAPYQEDDA